MITPTLLIGSTLQSALQKNGQPTKIRKTGLFVKTSKTVIFSMVYFVRIKYVISSTISYFNRNQFVMLIGSLSQPIRSVDRSVTVRKVWHLWRHSITDVFVVILRSLNNKKISSICVTHLTRLLTRLWQFLKIVSPPQKSCTP